MRQPFLRLEEYDRWANLATLAALRACPQAPERARRVLAHLAVTPQSWLSRIEQRANPWPDFWPDLSLDECEREIGRTFAAIHGLLTEADLDRVVAYRNSRGDAFESSVTDIFLHLSHHGAYHRGQINALLRAAGGSPPNTDYIVFTRQ